MLKIGQLFLQDGKYNGRQIVSKEYVNEAILPSCCNKYYGYLWWLGDNWFGCRGFGGQNITVVPKKNMIFVMQAVSTSRGNEYDDVFKYVNSMIY